MYAYEVQCEDECANCLYPTVSTFFGRDDTDLLRCVVLCCVVLCCLVLYYRVLSCLVLSCIALYCIVLSCIALHCIALYCTVLYCLVLSCLVLSRLVLSCLILSCLVLSCWQQCGLDLQRVRRALPPGGRRRSLGAVLVCRSLAVMDDIVRPSRCRLHVLLLLI